MDIKELEVVKMQPDDIVVLHVPQIISAQQREGMTLSVRATVGEGPKICIVDGGMKLGVVRTNAIDYRELLKKYMAEVVDSESVSFLGYMGGDRYSEEELAELKRIECEVSDE